MTIDVSLLNVVLQKASLLLDRLQTDHLALKEQEPTRTHKNSQSLNMESFVLRWDKNRGFTPINWACPLSHDILLHVDQQAKLLLANTQQFINGFPANNALLWGARGTGKSSLIQTTLAKFTRKQLQIIEINQQGFSDWLEIIEWIQANNTQKFIIFCDDLSFNENDSTYREIKAALDGSMTSLPENALIYASSNRRHLLPEKLADNMSTQHIDGEIHHSEAVEETISLSDRFGLWLSFHALTQNQYLDIVQHWLKEYGVDESLDSYRELALRWALQRGSRSGRIANQFARDFAGNLLLKKSES